MQNSVCIKLWCPARWLIVHKNKLIQENTYIYTVRFRLQGSENTTELAALWFKKLSYFAYIWLLDLTLFGGWSTTLNAVLQYIPVRALEWLHAKISPLHPAKCNSSVHTDIYIYIRKWMKNVKINRRKKRYFPILRSWFLQASGGTVKSDDNCKPGHNVKLYYVPSLS
jgi:hypothetical protein